MSTGQRRAAERAIGVAQTCHLFGEDLLDELFFLRVGDQDDVGRLDDDDSQREEGECRPDA